MFFDWAFLILVATGHLILTWATSITAVASPSSIEAPPRPQPTSSLMNASTITPNSGVYANDEVYCFTQEETPLPYINSTDCVDLLNILYVELTPLLPQRNFTKGQSDADNAFPVPAHWSLRSCSVLVDSESEPNVDVFRTYDVLRLAYEIFNQCVTPPQEAPLGGRAYARAKGFFVAVVRTNKVPTVGAEAGGD